MIQLFEAMRREGNVYNAIVMIDAVILLLISD